MARACPSWRMHETANGDSRLPGGRTCNGIGAPRAMSVGQREPGARLSSEGLIHRYFKGKAGLLLSIIRCGASQGVVDLHESLPLAPTVGDEIVQLVNWEVDRMWENREFLRVVIPRALLDPVLGQVFTAIGPLQPAKAIGERLRTFKECRALTDREVDALAHFVSALGFTFGFVRPLVLRQDRGVAREMAATIAGIMSRSFESAADIVRRPKSQEINQLFT